MPFVQAEPPVTIYRLSQRFEETETRFLLEPGRLNGPERWADMVKAGTHPCKVGGRDATNRGD